MNQLEEPAQPALALEITAALNGRRFGMCGFEPEEAQRIGRILAGAHSLAFGFGESLLSESARTCDGILIKLANLSPAGLRAAATSSAPIVVTGSSQALLEGFGAAYCWPRDFMNEPWPDAELLVRLFRLIAAPANPRTAGASSHRTDPMVLLADDDPELIALVEATLRNDGIDCRIAPDGLTALRMAREVAPDLILLDVRMPGMSGFDVLRTIRRDPSLETMPVILLTGCDAPSDLIRGSELHADQFITKPVSPNVLLNRVKRLLSTHSHNAPRWTRTLPGAVLAGRATKRWSIDRSSSSGALA